MAITTFPLTTATVAASDTLVTPSISPTAGRTVFLGIAAFDLTLPGLSPSPTIMGAGLTWSLIRLRMTSVRDLWAWGYVASGTPSTGALTLTFPHIMTEATVSVWECAGSTGTVVQSADARNEGVSGLTVTLAAFGSPTNGAFGVFTVGPIASGLTPGTGFTTIHANETPVNTGLLTEGRASADTSVDASWTGTPDAVAVAWELQAAAVSAPAGLVAERWRYRARG